MIEEKYKMIEEKYKDAREYIFYYKEEIERLKELCDKYEEEHKTTFKEWQDTIKRIDKAIDYIQNHQLVFELSSKKQIQYWFDMFYKDLLDILKGSDKE